VITHHADTFGGQRAFACSMQITTEWTLVLDSDEVLTFFKPKKKLKEAIRENKFDGY